MAHLSFNKNHHICIPLIFTVIFLAGCALEVQPPDNSDYIMLNEKDYNAVYQCTKADLTVEAENMVTIDLSQLSGDYTIIDAGNYQLSGNYSGQISIDAEEQIVHLFLNGADIYSLSGPAINILSAGKVIITLTEDTDNTLRDSAHYRASDKRDAAVYSDCDLTINGSGSLEVYGFYNDAIHSKDTIKILGGKIFIQAKGNGIQGNDGLLIDSASLHIECEGNGLYTTKTGKEEKGTIDISGGTVSIIAGKYAVVSSKDLYIRSCDIWSNSILGDFNVAGEQYRTEGGGGNE